MTGGINQPQLPEIDVGPSQPQLPQPIAGPSQHQPSSASPSHPQLPLPTAGLSQSLPQDPHQTVDSLEDTSSDLLFTKRSRGPTRCHQVWNMREGQRIFITTNNLGQPVNENASKLTNFLGTIARNGDYAPLTYSNWRVVPNEKKDDMYELVMSKFQFDKEIKSWVLMSIGKKWRDWKCELKKFHYLPHDNDEAWLADLNERVQKDQWKALIEFWNSEEGKVRNKINTKNRRKQRISHTAGTKSFARIREEERNKRANREDLTQVDMFLLTHRRKNGMPVDEASSRAMEQLNERTSQQPEASHNSTARRDIFSEVMGDERHGRVRTYGLGPSPSDIWGTTSHSVQSQGMTSNAQKIDEQYEELHAEISSLRETMADRDAQISSLRETMTTLMAAITNPSINLATLLGVSANPSLNQPSSSSSHLVLTPQRDLVNKGNSTSCTNVTQVLLKSIVRPGDTVAKGIVLSTDPLTKVGGQKLGVGFWEPYVDLANSYGTGKMSELESCLETNMEKFKTVPGCVGNYAGLTEPGNARAKALLVIPKNSTLSPIPDSLCLEEKGSPATRSNKTRIDHGETKLQKQPT
ncbi:uncharacterized protein LOC131226741 [Magnolia sinica]|uniref:uncharacterized protein LOC131226741 n=1 Tax=Magnolia sinica TaxID=86752 RepID=UPI00265B4DA0|nr:uncharacterized protein LOC131226741 [Magnolia sinica]